MNSMLLCAFPDSFSGCRLWGGGVYQIWAGMRELAASAFQRLGERHIDSHPWTYISKTARLRESACFAALRDWACSGSKHPCNNVES